MSIKHLIGCSSRPLRPSGVVLCLVASALGCQPSDHTPARDSLHDTGAAVSAAEHGHGDSAAERADGHAHAPATGGGQTLLVIMQQLGSHMTSLTQALMIGDKASVTSHATAIAAHPPLASDDLERIRKLLGSEMAQFESADAAVHNAAVQLRDAATSGETGAILTRLSELQRGCIACHDQFQQRLRAQRAP